MREALNVFYQAFCPYGEEELIRAFEFMRFNGDVREGDEPFVLFSWLKQSVDNGDYEDYFSVNLMQVLKDKTELDTYNSRKGLSYLSFKILELYGKNLAWQLSHKITLSDEGETKPFCVPKKLLKLLRKDKEKYEELLRIKEFRFLLNLMIAVD